MYRTLRGIWRLGKKYPFLQNLMSVAYYLLNFNSKRIHGKQNRVQIRGAFLKRVKISVIGDNNVIIIGRATHITRTRITLKGSNLRLELGANCIYYKGIIWIEDKDGQIIIGEGTSIQGAMLKATEMKATIRIGRDCIIGDDVEIRTGDLHSIIDMQTNKRINYDENIDIGDHVWIGAHVRVLKGVTIGEHSIVGTDAVVTRSIPSYCMAAGVPARIIRENVSWVTQRIHE